MALASAVLTFLELLGFCLGFASLGNLLLRILRLEMESHAEQALVTVALGLVTTEILLFLVQITQHIRLGCFAAIVIFFGVLVWEWKSLRGKWKAALRQVVPQSPAERVLLTLVAGVALVEFLSSQAPLTGSDALHYHFAVQKQILDQGFHPVFSISHSFLCGLHHSLILLGLTLGGERLALGFIFLGGLLTAAALACLASRCVSGATVTGFALLFLLTPVVFWQVTSSGSPDIYMAFLTTAAVLALVQKNSTGTWRQALLIGFLAGGIAGAKYTGCLIAAALAVAVIVEFRSAIGASLFLVGSMVSGAWPYLRNLAWTGNPVFPFLAERISPEHTTTYGMANLYSDTGVSSSHYVGQLLPIMLFAGARESRPGLWEFFGPAVLVLAPLIVFAFKNERLWRVLVLVWVSSSLAIAFSSGLVRFLLPVFPLALVGAAAGFEASLREGWTVGRRFIGSLLFVTALACAAGLSLYCREPLRVAVGLEEKTDYLRERGPEYQIAEFVNKVLGGRKQQRTLVFLRHLYYLNVPYVNGDPGTSFAVDPAQLQTTRDWKAFFEKENIGYMVRAPNYPDVLAAPLEELEKLGDLTPIAQTEVQSFQGMRVNQVRATISVVILKVNR